MNLNVGSSLFRRTVWSSVFLVSGVTIHFWMIGLADRLVGVFPSVKDILLLQLPLIYVGYIGEVAFVLFLTLFAWRHFRYQRELTPRVFYAIGALYLLRGVFLLLLPIGAPVGAPPDPVTVYPYPNHSYFPGGHVGLMMLLAFSIQDRRWRWGLIGLAVAFGVGTMLTRAHYTADTVSGMVNAYAVASAFGLVHQPARRL